MEPSIRIAYLIDNLARAGTQTVLQYLVAGLSQRGYDQRVVCLNDRVDPQIVAELERAGGDIRIAGRRQIAVGYGLLTIFREFRTWQPHIVQTFLPVSDIVGRTLARLARVPVVVTSIRARNIDKSPLQFWLDRQTMRWADQVVFNAASVVDFSIANEGVRADQVTVIPNGVKILKMQGEAKSERSPYVIGTVGRLRPQKGIETLIRAFAIFREAYLAELWIIGEGELRPALEGEAARLGVADSVRFLGIQKDIPSLLQKMDAYAHAAVFEGMPNAVMEAMAAGLPVVATEVDGTQTLIVDDETGWLVPPGDAGQMAGRLVKVYENQEKSGEIGKAAARYMAENFSVEKMVSRFDDLYRDLIKRKAVIGSG